MDAGERTSRVIFLRPVKAENAMGEDEETGAPAVYARAWARVKYGNAAERRSAAQESAVQTATFAVPYSAKLAALTTADQVQFAGGIWDIRSAVPVGDRDGIEVTATRSAP